MSIPQRPSLRDELRSMRRGWPQIWDHCRETGLRRSSPLLAQAVLATVIIFTITIGEKISPWAEHRRARRRDKAFDTFVSRKAPPTDIMTIEVDHPQPRPGDESQTRDMFFAVLPPEIRRTILVMAFGEQTIHMDLQYRRPWHHTWTDRAHGGLPISKKAAMSGKKFIVKKRCAARKWRWYSCVCHRYPPNGQAWLSHGRRRNFPPKRALEPQHDTCLMGRARCGEWKGGAGKNCYVGVMGWLLTCKKAYIEGFEVLYRTNTFHISSPFLIKRIPDLLPERVLRNITSLEVAWPADLRMYEGFRSRRIRGRPRLSFDEEPAMPSLAHLRICYNLDLPVGSVNPAMMLPTFARYDDQPETLDYALQWHFLHPVVGVIERICPKTTDVTVSLPSWKWYNIVDKSLIASQGLEETKPQRAEMEGLKCWKICNRGRSGERRRGFWVHIEGPKVDLSTDEGQYDWQRHQRYGLGDAEYALEAVV